jgi:hypothetical protein
MNKQLHLAYWKIQMSMNKILLLCIPLALAGCNAIDASADGGYGDYHYHDVLKPHGRARSVATLQADGSRCQRRTGHGGTLADLPGIQSDPNYRNCMSAHGWRFYAYTPAPVSPHHHEMATSSDDIPSSPVGHDSTADAMETNRMIDAANAETAAETAAIAAASQANADALTAATQ